MGASAPISFLEKGMQKEFLFDEIIEVSRYSSCKSCETYIYTLPCNIFVDFEKYMFSVGGLQYPLSKVKMIRIDNEYLKATSRVGRNWLEVKFKRNKDEFKPLWDLAIAAYVESQKDIKIRMK